MRPIITVTGEIAPERLGFCQFHEHLLICDGMSRKVNDALFMDNVELSAQEAITLRNAGGNTVIDAQPGGCGRMAAGLEWISKTSGLSVICSTGFHKLGFYPSEHWIFRETENIIAEFFIRELTEGVDPDCEQKISGKVGGQRAGIIKCALDTENLSLRYQTLFRAAVRAALETDRILMIHIEKGSDPLDLFAFLKSEGMSPERLVFCHLDRAADDIRVHQKLLERGTFLEFDTIGRFKYHSDEDEIRLFQEHLRAGFGEQLLFSLDTTRTRLAAYGPTEIGLDYIRRVFLGKMLTAGITQEQIDQIARKNPLRALAGIE